MIFRVVGFSTVDPVELAECGCGVQGLLWKLEEEKPEQRFGFRFLTYPPPPLPPKFFPTHPNSLETLDYTTRTTPPTPAPKPTVQGQRLSEVARQTSFGAAELFGGDPGPKPEPPQKKDDKASVDLLSELEKEV